MKIEADEARTMAIGPTVRAAAQRVRELVEEQEGGDRIRQPQGKSGPMPPPNGRLVATKPTPWYIAGPQIIPFTRVIVDDVTMRTSTRYERAVLWLRRVAACIRTRL